VFPVRYGLDSYVLLTRSLVFKGLKELQSDATSDIRKKNEAYSTGSDFVWSAKQLLALASTVILSSESREPILLPHCSVIQINPALLNITGTGIA
jgi:hypothetical protein